MIPGDLINRAAAEITGRMRTLLPGAGRGTIERMIPVVLVDGVLYVGGDACPSPLAAERAIYEGLLDPVRAGRRHGQRFGRRGIHVPVARDPRVRARAR